MSTDRWETPPDIFDPLMKEFNFDLDTGTRGAFTGSCDSCVVVWNPSHYRFITHLKSL